MNIQKVLTIGLLVNSLLILGILIAVVNLCNNQYGNNLEKPALTDQAATKNVGNGSNSAAIPAPAIAKTVEIAITDDGFAPLGFSANTGEIIALSIKNDGQKSHSVKIDGLGFDSGIVAPGATITAQLPALANEPKNYEYYSGSDEKSGNFLGTIMVLKK